MVEIKTAFKFLDVFWSLVCGYVSMDILPIIAGGTTYIFSTIDNIIKVAFAFAGLIYFIVRLINYSVNCHFNYLLRKEELEIKKQEVYDRKLKSFKPRFYHEFIEPFDVTEEPQQLNGHHK